MIVRLELLNRIVNQPCRLAVSILHFLLTELVEGRVHYWPYVDKVMHLKSGQWEFLD